jgi:hypothetical protein
MRHADETSLRKENDKCHSEIEQARKGSDR